MVSKPTINTSKIKKISITIQYVFRANFNDTYFLDNIIINLDELNKDELTWFDPFYGRSKLNNTTIAIAYCSDDEFIVLEKKNDIINKATTKSYMDYIVCEDYDESMLLASHITLRS